MRYAGKLFHLGIGRAFKRQKVLMVIADNHVITSLAETGEVITEHYIDTARDYRPYWKQKDRVKGQNVCLARRVAGVRFGLFECRLSGCSRCR